MPRLSYTYTDIQEQQFQMGRETIITYSCWIVAIGQDIQQISR